MLDGGSLLLLVHMRGNLWRVIYSAVGVDENMTVDDLRVVWKSLMPLSIPESATFQNASFFKVSCRIAESYRRGRCLLAGDAAHCHSPAGGQGMNTGLQDAANLAWKLAGVLQGHADDALIASYEVERRPIAEWVLERSDAAFGAFTGASRVAVVLRGVLARLVLPMLPSDMLPPPAVRDKLFGLTHTYAAAGTCATSGRPTPAHGALAPGDRLPDCPCLIEGGAGEPWPTTLLRLLCPLRLCLRILLLGPPAAGADRRAPERLVAEARSVSSWPLELWSWSGSGRTVAHIHLRPPGADTLRGSLGLGPAEEAVVVVRPDGYIAGIHRGPCEPDGDVLARMLRQIGMASRPRARL